MCTGFTRDTRAVLHEGEPRPRRATISSSSPRSTSWARSRPARAATARRALLRRRDLPPAARRDPAPGSRRARGLGGSLSQRLRPDPRSAMTDLPASARVVIVGGGIVGCSVAYHLGKLGWTDVLLLEQGQLTSGSTWHAAGLVGQLRTSANITQLLGYSVELYDRLEAETGQATGWKRNGGLRLACTRRALDRGAPPGDDRALLRAGDAPALGRRRRRTLWPLMTVDDVVGAAFLPTDGQANPADITQALAKGARMAGRDAARGRGGDRLRARARPGARRAHHGRAGSPARRSSSAPASGRGRSRPWPGSTCRWSRSSTSTSSPSQSRA